MAEVEACPSSGPAAEWDKIFPLPLTAFETLMYLDSRPGYPMLVDFELSFAGCIDRAAFETGLAFALSRNPLLAALVAPVPHARHCWQWVRSNQRPAVDWAALGTPICQGYGSYIDLAQAIGLKIWVRSSPEQSMVLLHFHHACSDAVGMYGFLEDLLVGYHAAVPGSAPVDPRPLEPERLVKRGWLQVPARTPWQQVGDQFTAAREGWRFCTEAPLPLGAQAASAVESAGNPPFVRRTLGPETVRGLRRAAAAVGGTRNDVLVRDLMLTLSAWPSAGRRPAGWRNMRVCVPQNLRDPDDARMPACNAISFAFLTRRARRSAAPDALLASIVQEMAAVRRWKLSLFFLAGLATLQPLGVLSWFLRRSMCFATAVLSNMGDPAWHFRANLPWRAGGLAVGNLTLQGLVGSPPVRGLTRAALGVIGCGDAMTISLRCDPGSFSPDEAEKLLDEYVSRLRTTAALADAADSLAALAVAHEKGQTANPQDLAPEAGRGARGAKV